MRRILKPCSRPYIALGIVLSTVAILGMVLVLRTGKPRQAIQLGGGVLALYGVVCLTISLQRIVVESDSVAFLEPFKPTNRVRFSDISKSIPRSVAEPDHPVALDIYTHDAKRPALRLRLKSFRQVDVTWLVSVPELRVAQTNYPIHRRD